MLQLSIIDMTLKMTNLQLQQHLPGANELKLIHANEMGRRRAFYDVKMWSMLYLQNCLVVLNIVLHLVVF